MGSSLDKIKRELKRERVGFKSIFKAPLLFWRNLAPTAATMAAILGHGQEGPPNLQKNIEKEMPASDSDWDYPLTDDDLRAIDSVISSAQPPKRHSPSCRHGDEDDGASVDSPPKSRRRLPTSLFVFRQQQQRNVNFSTAPFSPCSSRRYHSRNIPQASPFQDIKFGGRIVYSRTKEEVERAAQELLDYAEAKTRNGSQCILGLDIEWRPTFTRGVPPGKAAVMQICGDNSSCHVLHIIHSGIPKNLRSLLEDNTSVKVGVCIANDASKILKDYDVSINTLRDLSDIANQKLGGDPKKWSLSSLAEMLICKQLPKPKMIRLGNWEVDPLSNKQLKYAATDAYVSWYLYQVLNNYPDPVANEATETDVT